MNIKSANTFKVVLAGDHQSGKTLFMMRWHDPDGSHMTVPTIATQLLCQTVEIQGATYKIQLWDTAGQETYHSITAPYFRSANGVFLVFDLTNKASFLALDYWLNLIGENAHKIPVIVLVANKSDLPDREIDTEQVAAYARQKGLGYFITSALTGENIENAANYMVATLVASHRKRLEEEVIEPQEAPKPEEGCC
jgi:small GTP-binding protein